MFIQWGMYKSVNKSKQFWSECKFTCIMTMKYLMTVLKSGTRQETENPLALSKLGQTIWLKNIIWITFTFLGNLGQAVSNWAYQKFNQIKIKLILGHSNNGQFQALNWTLGPRPIWVESGEPILFNFESNTY